jgi:nicotinate-nucleotide adenylyltransferase
MKIGICGGTFDPFHRGHLEPVLAARDAMQWDRVVYVPARRQPFKLDQNSASGFHRFTMAVLATENAADVFISPAELEREQVSYTVDTLEQMRADFPDATLDWIIGHDNVEKLGEWKNIDRIFELANFAVLSRNADAADEGCAFPTCVSDASERPQHGAIVYAHNTTVPVSSTEIRRKVRAGEPIDELVDPRVSRYIHHYRLYREHS